MAGSPATACGSGSITLSPGALLVGAAVVEAGATRLAVVRAIRDAADPAEAARSFRALLPN